MTPDLRRPTKGWEELLFHDSNEKVHRRDGSRRPCPAEDLGGKPLEEEARTAEWREGVVGRNVFGLCPQFLAQSS